MTPRPPAATATTEFRMPSLGADMESGILLEWLVHPGDKVHKGDIVAVVDTSKAAVEIECFATGQIKDLLVEPGTRVPVGDPLATIQTQNTQETPPNPAATAPAEPVHAQPTPAAAPPAPETSTPPHGIVTSPLVRRLAQHMHIDTSALTGTGPVGQVTHADVLRRGAQPTRIKASPWARRVAADLHVDLNHVHGTGPDGAIRAHDVHRSDQAAPLEPPATPPTATTRTHQTSTESMRATIAALMARSKREIPHYYLTEQIDLGPAITWLHEQNRHRPVPDRILPAAMLLKAAARAAAEVRELNGFWIEDHLTTRDAVHLGVAISLRGGGLIAPAIHDADAMPIPELMAAMRDLVTRTRAGRLRSGELADPTITVSSVGEQGAESILGVIYPPQVALVGFGRIVERPWALDGLLGIRPIVTASLSADHRATDGATGSRYLQALARLLHQPEEL